MAFGLIISPFWTVFVSEPEHFVKYFFGLDLDGKINNQITAQVKALKFYPSSEKL